jgi:hypothetical protein
VQNREKSKGRVVNRARLLLPAPKGTSGKVRRIIDAMRDGEVKLVAKRNTSEAKYEN